METVQDQVRSEVIEWVTNHDGLPIWMRIADRITIQASRQISNNRNNINFMMVVHEARTQIIEEFE